MSIFDDIRKDAEDGTPGPWRAEQPHFANGWWVVFTDPDTDGTIDESGDGGFEEHTARRIARVPQLEAIALAAEKLADAVQVYDAAELDASDPTVSATEAAGLVMDTYGRVLDALHAFRGATK